MTLLVVACMLGRAPAVFADVHHPVGAFAQFADCPLDNPATAKCIVDETNNTAILDGELSVATAAAVENHE
jgi:hypothetical protein